MNPSDLAASISNALTQLDTILASGVPDFNTPEWQQLFALRKHLDDQQRSLLQQTIQSNDATFVGAAGDVKTATAGLTSAIKRGATIDSIINIVAQVSSAVDTVLKLV
jgi:transcriptional regulator with GAF, ATPase, and Fis domain